ncbi:conserved hypothetical protein [Acidianus hospitalis W1]|uniref:Uncharacterized protein n=1 Tax=Acidianus hospitalis (strain W1) TaxID=933801 RepID=F4B532_ACIHW|nr:hypothetical protein [Acidianus hospitalis]AEE94334.1 conserved hypothetical protein [Acidianus hospitalis W1]
MVIKLTEEIEMNDDESSKLWFYDKKNIIDCIPNLVGFSENKIKLRVKNFFFLNKTLEYEITSFVGGGYIEHKFKNEDSFATLLITFNKNRKIISLSLSYSGKFERQMSKILEEMMKNLKRKYLEQKTVNKKGETISSKLSSLSFVAKLVSTSKLIYSDKLDSGKIDITPFIEDILHKFSQYPIIYISGFNEENTFRLLFVNGELKGVYIKISDKEFYSEEELLKLKGLFHVSVYANLLKSSMVI